MMMILFMNILYFASLQCSSAVLISVVRANSPNLLDMPSWSTTLWMSTAWLTKLLISNERIDCLLHSNSL